MRILIYGAAADHIKSLVKKIGFEIGSINPNVIISYGGDGTLLSAERLYPGIPKLPIRHDQICRKCAKHADQTVLKGLLHHKLALKEYRKLSTNINGKNLYALNDFIVRNVLPMRAIRFKTLQNNKLSQLLIGDGIVVATPFGSTGYFQSITKQTFSQGFGLAFNNVTEAVQPLLLDEDTEVGFQLVRGHALLAYDNSDEVFQVPEGEKLTFKLSGQMARIFEDTLLRCPDCKINRD